VAQEAVPIMNPIASRSIVFFALIAAFNLHSQVMHSTRHGNIPRVLLVYDDRYVKIEVLSDELIHFESAEGAAPALTAPIYTTPMVAQKEFPGPSNYYETKNGLETANLIISFDHAQRCIVAFDKARNFAMGTICPFNLSQSWKGLRFKSPMVKNLYGLGQYFTNAGTSDGDLIDRVWDPLPQSHGHAVVPFSGGANTRALFPIIYALGNSSDNFAIFVDNIYKQMWTMNERPWQGQWQAEMWGDQIRWYLIAGKDLPALRHTYMNLTGHPALPSKRVLGLWVSEFGFDNWQELKQKLADLIEKKFPLEGFAMDIQWFGGRFYERGSDTSTSRMGALEFDRQAFPNVEREIALLRKDFGLELMLIEESYISKSLPIHQRMSEQGFLAHHLNNTPVFLDANPWWGVGGMIDWTNARGADFWHDTKRQKLIDMGIHFHWADLGEPEMYDPGAYYYGFPEIGKNRHADVHNIYAFKWLESIDRGYKRNLVKARPYAMSRAGTSGIQRFGGMWSGDLGANMGSLTAHLNAAMHLSLSGLDYYSSDIGGFHRAPNATAAQTKELYTQWFANATLFDLPVRPHAWNVANDIETSPSLMGDVASNLYNIRLRYSLAPYYYSLMHRAHADGEPILPPPVYYFQKDPNLRTVGHERMIGPSLLAGVVANYGELARPIYLPKGRWYDYHTGELYNSAGEWSKPIKTVHDGIFRLPLFARAGAIIPLMSIDEESMNILGERRDHSVRVDLSLRIYANAAPSEFTIFEDDALTTAHEDNALSTTKVAHALKDDSALITIDAALGDYTGMPKERPLLIDYYPWSAHHAGAIQTLSVNGQELNACSFKEGQENACFVPHNNFVRIKLGSRPLDARQEVKIVFKNPQAAS